MRHLQLPSDRMQTRTGDDGSLTLDGIAVPWDDPISYGGITEQFARGAIDPAKAVGRPLLWSHDRAEPIGHITAAEDTDAGLAVEAVVQPTARGRDAITLLRSGSLRGLSVGFTPIDQRNTPDGVIYTRVDLAELSTTPLPAYTAAAVTATRDEETIVAEETTTETREADLAPIKERLEHVEALVRAAQAPGSPLSQYRTLGEFTVAAYHDPALIRALADQITGNNPGVVPDGWVSDVKGIIDMGRNFITALGGAASLPSSGMNVNWPYWAGDLSAIVAEQTAQKSEVNTVRVDILKGTGGIKTFAAGSDVALQLIERSEPSYLDALMRIYMAAYAYTTNAYAVTAAEAAAGDSITYDPAAKGSFYTAVVEANIKCYRATGRKADVVAVREASYASIAGAVDSEGHPMYPPSGYGTTNVGGVAGGDREARIEIDGTPVIPVPGLTAVALATNSAAFQYMEDGPKSISADVVARLGRDVAVYGYSFGAPYLPGGIVEFTQTAAAARSGK